MIFSWGTAIIFSWGIAIPLVGDQAPPSLVLRSTLSGYLTCRYLLIAFHTPRVGGLIQNLYNIYRFGAECF